MNGSLMECSTLGEKNLLGYMQFSMYWFLYNSKVNLYEKDCSFWK